jgi:hypothetical protein
MKAMLRKVEGLVLAEFEDGFMIYHPDGDRVHYLTRTAALVLELCTGRNSAATITQLLGEAYGLTQPPTEQVGRVVENLLSKALVSTSGERESRRASPSVSPERRIGVEEKLLASVAREGRGLVKRLLAEKVYVIPAIESFPIDGLSVSSAKCSSRWANLEDNTCYTRSDQMPSRGWSNG